MPPQPNPTDDALNQLPLNDPDFDPTTVPFVASIVSGELPGVLITEADMEAMRPLDGNGRSLFTKAGLVMSPTSAGAALFNPDTIKLSEIRALDKAGRLPEVLPSVSSVAGGATSTPVGDAEPVPREPIPFGGVSTPPAAPGVQRKLAAQRGRNLALAGAPPTSTDSPSSRIMGALRAPVV